MSYSVEFSTRAAKQFSKLDGSIQQRIQPAIDALREAPRPFGSRKITASSPGDFYRIRIGEYRVIYEVKDGKLIILVIAVGHRKDVYRGL